jgi:hypothetical protein
VLLSLFAQPKMAFKKVMQNIIADQQRTQNKGFLNFPLSLSLIILLAAALVTLLTLAHTR